jgi:O-antigen/teichoic acid export membrane protein
MYRVTRDHQFSRIVMLRLTQIFFYITIGLSLAFTIHPVDGIILADAAGRLGSMAAATVLLKRDGYPVIEFRRLAQLPAFLKRHRELPLVSLPGAMSSSFGGAITPVMMFATFGAAVTGQYSLLDRSINVPLAMIITASSQVFAAQLAHHLRAQTGLAKRLFMRTALGCLSVSIAGALVVQPFLPFLFNLIYGPGWTQSASFAQVMIFAYGVVFASGVTNQTLVCLCDFRLQACLGLLSPLAYGGAWAFIRSFHIPIYEAVVIHASVVTCLGLAFLITSVIALSRMPSESAQSLKNVAADSG